MHQICMGFYHPNRKGNFFTRGHDQSCLVKTKSSVAPFKYVNISRLVLMVVVLSGDMFQVTRRKIDIPSYIIIKRQKI